MAALLKKRDDNGVAESLAARSALKLARANNNAKAVPSPARELQSALAQRLNEDRKQRSHAVIGTITGLIGSTFMLTLLIYAAP